MYLGGPTTWRRSADTLTEEQQRIVRSHDATGTAYVAVPRQLSDSDADLLVALQKDGRASHAELAQATGWSPVTVARRLADLQAGGAVFFDVEVDTGPLGANTRALLWMSVRPAEQENVATTLAGHDELAFVAATTGPTNLVAQALCKDPADLHRYLAHRLGSLDAIHTLETSPVLQNVKAASPMMTDLARSRRSAPTPRARS